MEQIKTKPVIFSINKHLFNVYYTYNYTTLHLNDVTINELKNELGRPL